MGHPCRLNRRMRYSVDCRLELNPGFGRRGTCPEAEAVGAGFQDVAVMGEPIEQSRGHLGIAERACPFAEAEIGGDDDAGLLVEFASRWNSSAPPDGLNGR